MQINKIDKNKNDYMELLLDADPDKDIVEEYLKDSDMYVVIVDNIVVCDAVITKYDENTCELKNIATLPKYRGRGYASFLIKYLFEEYKTKYEKMIVGTTENMIPFYVLNGFKTYKKKIKNFFVDNYKEEIYDGDFHCIDMYYYSKNLK